MNRSIIRTIAFSLLVSIFVLSSCSQGQSPVPEGTSSNQNAGLQQSSLARATDVQVPQSDADTLSTGNRTFAVDLYRQLRGEDGNLIFSPYSISLAMAMVSAGAREQTASQIDSAMHFDLPSAQLHPAFNALDSSLESLGVPQGTPAPTDEFNSGDDFQLSIANQLWGQADFSFLSEYLDLLAQNYGAGLRTLDFEKDPEAARKVINDWVSEQTKQKINDLFAQGTINTDTRLVLANAIYFKASWADPFEKNATSDGDFTLLDGSKVSVPMMTSAKAASEYLKGNGYQAVSLPYKGWQTKIVIVLPDDGQFDTFESNMDTIKLDEILKGLSYSEVDLTLPKFKVESEFNLNQILSSLGISDAFNPDLADFSGMDGKRDLFISQVVHKAYIATDESGTEAAAATGIAMEAASMPAATPPVVVVDRPFLFFIYAQNTGTILFEGRVLDPSK